MKCERVEGVLIVSEKRASSVSCFGVRLYADEMISSVSGGCRCFKHQGIDLKCLMSSSGDGWRMFEAMLRRGLKPATNNDVKGLV